MALLSTVAARRPPISFNRYGKVPRRTKSLKRLSVFWPRPILPDRRASKIAFEQEVATPNVDGIEEPPPPVYKEVEADTDIADALDCISFESCERPITSENAVGDKDGTVDDRIEAYDRPLPIVDILVCDTCHNLKPHQKEYRLALELTPELLMASALSGCAFCSILQRGPTFHVAEPLDHVRHITILGDFVDDERSLLRMKVHASSDFAPGRTTLELEFSILEDSLIAGPAFKTACRIPWNTASEQSLNWAHERMEHCILHHDICLQISPCDMPSRLIEVRSDGDLLHTKLIDSQLKSVPYVCLSHSWGDLRHIMTNEDNLLKHHDSIDWRTSPPTFRDAIDFTHRLGYTHLWIDSLCIVQDRVSDWATEAKKMASIYRGSVLTLAATTAANDLQGCYVKSSYEPEYCLATEEAPCPVYVRQSIPHWGCREIKTQKNTFPLLSRGWFYQERMMAPRLLHFTQGELVWECKGEMRCECAMGAPSSLKSSGALLSSSSNAVLGPSRPSRPTELSDDPLSDERKAWRAEWHRHVEQFSRLDLTVESDRLPALAGLGSDLYLRRGSSYAGGLWLDTISSDLLWRATSPALRRSTAAHLPTWSWASVIGGVCFLPLRRLPISPRRGYLTLVHADCVPVNEENQFGDIRFGFLEVFGLAVPATVYWDVPEDDTIQERYRVLLPFRDAVPNSFDGGVFLDLDRSVRQRGQEQDFKQIPDVYTFYPDYRLRYGHQIINHDEVYALRIGTLTFMILCRSQSRRTGFERIGVLDCSVSPLTESLHESYDYMCEWDLMLAKCGYYLQLVVY